MITPKRFFRRIKWLAIFLMVWNILGVGVFEGSGSLFYVVKEQYGRVLTKMNGNREIKTETGIYFRFLSLDPREWVKSTKEFSRRVEYIYLDNNREAHEMQAADKVKFYGAGVWTYKIIDLHKFGIEMGDNALEMLTAELNGIAKAIIQAYPVETNVTNIDYINLQVNTCADVKKIETKYGIAIESFRLMHATYPQELNEKTAAAKGLKIFSEAVKESANNIGMSRKTLADANKYHLDQLIKGSGITTEEGKRKALEILKDLILYEMLEKRPPGEIIYVIPYGNAQNMTLPSPGEKRRQSSEAQIPEKSTAPSLDIYGVPK